MDLIQNELINKAFTLKFESYFGVMISINKKCYHLWLTDLQKWLREVHKIKVLIDHSPSGEYKYTIYKWNFNNNKGIWERLGNMFHYETFETALEAGLFEALKLIKDEK